MDQTPDDRTDENSGSQPIVTAQDARQGEIILRSRAQRLIFIAGLAIPVVILLVIAVLYFFNSPFPMSDH